MILYKCSQLVHMYILYCSIFLPYINYCSEIWGNTYPTNINGIVILKKRAMRLLYGANHIDHTTPLFYRSHALNFLDLVKFKTAVFMFKAYKCNLPVNIQHFVKSVSVHVGHIQQARMGNEEVGVVIFNKWGAVV